MTNDTRKPDEGPESPFRALGRFDASRAVLSPPIATASQCRIRLAGSRATAERVAGNRAQKCQNG